MRVVYQRYIASDTWVRRAHRFKNRVGNVCQGCGTQQNLHVHHRSYERLGHERDSDLRVLCQTCHDDVHHLVRNGMALDAATDLAIDKKASTSTHEPPPFVPLNQRPGYQIGALTGREGRLSGLPIVTR